MLLRFYLDNFFLLLISFFRKKYLLKIRKYKIIFVKSARFNYIVHLYYLIIHI